MSQRDGYESEVHHGDEPEGSHCPECGFLGDIKTGYGGIHAFECPRCGEEWTV